MCSAHQIGFKSVLSCCKDKKNNSNIQINNSKRIKELYYNRFKDKPMNQILAESSYNCDGKIMLKV